MDPTKQGGAASSKPYSDLDARLLAMRLGDPSSSRQQAWYPAPTPLLPPSPQKELAPTATPAVRPLLRLPPSPLQEFVPTATSVKRPPPENPPQPKPQELVPTNSLDVRLLQQLQAVRQYWPQSLPQLLGYGGGESSAGAGCVSPVGASSSSSIFASLYGKHSPRFNASAAPFLSKVPKPSKLSASAEDFQPIPQSNPSMAQSSSTPSSSTSQCLPQLGAAAASSTRHDNASLDPYASALLTGGHAYQDESQWWGRAPAIGLLPWLDEVQARLLYAQRKPASVTSAGAAEHVVHLLAERGEEVRLRVLDAVKRAVHRVMGCREGHVGVPGAAARLRGEVRRAPWHRHGRMHRRQLPHARRHGGSRGDSSEGAHQGGGAVPPTVPATHHLSPARTTDGTWQRSAAASPLLYHAALQGLLDHYPPRHRHQL